MEADVKGSLLARYSSSVLADRVVHRKIATPGENYLRCLDRPQKYAIREQMLSHFSVEEWPTNLRMLTFPGFDWGFEFRLVHERGRFNQTRITCIERDEAVFRASLRYLRPIIQTKAPTYATTEIHAQRPYIKYLRCDWESCVPHPPKRLLNAAWLDFNGPISRQRAAALSIFLRTWMQPRSRIAVTLLNGRYDQGTAQDLANRGADRLAALQEWLIELSPHPTKFLEATSFKDTAPMLHFVFDMLGPAEANEPLPPFKIVLGAGDYYFRANQLSAWPIGHAWEGKET